MSTGQYGTEELTKAVGEVKEIIDDVNAARDPESAGGKKITWGEGIGLVVSDAGKVIKITNAAEAIWNEIKDLDTGEAPEVVAAFKQLYSPKNPYVDAGANKTVLALIAIKEAGENFAKAKDWEEENK